AGRNYGLVSQDPGDPSKVVLISGTDTWSVFNDLRNGTLLTDPWGAIERHVTIYDHQTNELSDRFFSNAHDDSDGQQFENRIVYPAHALISMASGPSRIVYNVYTKGHWYLHISEPGTTRDLFALKDVFLWDLQDTNGDGIREWWISPTRLSDEPDVPGYYFPHWKTTAYHWNEHTKKLEALKTYSEVVPYLIPSFREEASSTTAGVLYPVLVTRQYGGRKVLLVGQSGPPTPFDPP